MRKRRRLLKNADPVEAIKGIYRRFSRAVYIEKDQDKAAKIRQQAEAVLKSNPDLKENVPVRIGRAAFIDWDRFIDFPKTKTMEID